MKRADQRAIFVAAEEDETQRNELDRPEQEEHSIADSDGENQNAMLFVFKRVSE
jgi:hypothetical protein